MAIMHFFLNKKKCAGSLCSVHSGLSECTLTGDLSSSSTDNFALCLATCTGASTTNTCKPTSSIDAFGGRQVSLRAGTSCAGTNGYCDMFGRCRAVDLFASHLVAHRNSQPDGVRRGLLGCCKSQSSLLPQRILIHKILYYRHRITGGQCSY